MGLLIHIDGGARGNPGPAGAGVVIQRDDGRALHEAGYFLGTQTNNSAEYRALLLALQRVKSMGHEPLSIHSDSELLVRQVTGEYRVKSPSLAELFRQAQMMLLRFACWSIKHVRREENRRADELANLAMDAGRDVIVFDADEDPRAAPGEVALTGPTTAAADAQAARGAPEPTPVSAGAIRITLDRAPGQCPAGSWMVEPIVCRHVLPTPMCVHAAGALLPTIIAMLKTDAQEFAAVPTMTVRCSRAGCGAVFLLAPQRSSNGRPK
ncbi:14.7 kDa ribonuclease H-like protein [Phycisphaerae bacterium RAS1]|nr:14.7 kDa ribonuclease H-like protein [Phycisphaerae bacterium RAS1]